METQEMTCKICRLPKKHHWVGEKLKAQIDKLCREERNYIKWVQEFWRYEFWANEPVPCAKTIYTHKTRCLRLPSNFSNPYWKREKRKFVEFLS